jgi:NAD(P)-dependent dehydrogenase (short-subunit alcohol dehydrogenase family)
MTAAGSSSARRLEGRTAVVTGSSTGNGRSIALELAAEGANVLCSDLRRDVHPDALDEHGSTDTDALIVERGGSATFLRADVTRAEDMKALAATAVETFGGLDIWVNNAGIGLAGSIFDEAQEQFEQTYRVNVTGTWLGAHAAARVMKAAARTGRSRGRIINIGSVAAEIGQGPGIAAYASSKGAVHALTRELAIELAPDFINVNAIVPGYFLNTAMNRQVRESAEFRELALSKHPWPEMAPTSDLGRAAVFLASDDAAWTTGVLLPVDGGLLAT